MLLQPLSEAYVALGCGGVLRELALQVTNQVEAKQWHRCELKLWSRSSERSYGLFEEQKKAEGVRNCYVEPVSELLKLLVHQLTY
jgi:hypothetical protein